MTEQVKTQQSCGEYSRTISWYPLRKWWLLDQDFRREDEEGLQGSLEACSQHLPAPLFVPHISGSKCSPVQIEEQYWWRVSLDVVHFLPSEISLRIRDSFLEVTGKHEDREDEHGFTARCFTRKYRLPAEADVTKIVSSLCADGILTVEAPIPERSVPALTIIPIKVEMEKEKEKGSDMFPRNGTAPDHPDFPAAEDEGEVLPLEDRIYDSQCDSAAMELQQKEETEPAGESCPSVSTDGRSADTLKQPEPEVMDEDVPAGSRGTKEGMTQPEVSQLGKGAKTEEGQELEDQELEEQVAEDQKPEDQESEEQGSEVKGLEDQQLEEQQLGDQEPKDQELDDQEPKDKEPKDQEPQDQEPEDQELEDQEPKHQEFEYQGSMEQENKEQEPKDKELEDQEPKDQELEDQEPNDQKPKEQEPEDPEPEDKELEDPEPKDQELEDRKPKNQKPKEQEPEDQELEDQKPKEQEPEDQEPEDQEPEDQEIKQEHTK